jgi:hypothetical protein
MRPRGGDEGWGDNSLFPLYGAITITAASHRRLVYGIHTLLYLARLDADAVQVPACTIEDWPDFRMRGLQDDPARGQVSTLEGFERIIRELSRLKFNVLTFQTFGHAGRVTSLPEFHHLSDHPQGGSHYSPAVPAVYDFFSDLFSEIAEVFDGDTIHIGCDEVTLAPLGLRSSPMVRDRGVPAPSTSTTSARWQRGPGSTGTGSCFSRSSPTRDSAPRCRAARRTFMRCATPASRS